MTGRIVRGPLVSAACLLLSHRMLLWLLDRADHDACASAGEED